MPKKIYLLQYLGTDLGYTYNWYVHGPYSPSLTNYIYNNLEVLLSNDYGKYKLSQSAEDNINKVNDLINGKTTEFGEASWYELLASLIYIYKNKRSWKIVDNNENALFDVLIKQKPQYNEEQCKCAFNVLKKNGFVPEALG